MRQFAQQLFRFAPGEGSRIIRFALLGLLLQAGLSLGTSAADSLFLVNVGVERLPHIYLLTPVMMLLYIPAYSALLARWGIDRVFDFTLAILVAGGLTLWLLCAHFAGATPRVLCYAAKLYAALWYVGLYTLYWNFLDSYFDLADAKRLFALFAAGSATGAIIGGSLVGVVSGRFGVSALFFGWALCAVLAWPVLFSVRRHERKLATDEPDEAGTSLLSGAVAASVQIVRSRYALVLTAVLFLTLVNATVCEYQYMGILSAGVDEASLAGLFGRLTAMVNVLNLAISLFFFNKLVARLGVRNVALIQPVVYAVVFAWLLLDGGYPAAVAGFFAYQGIEIVIDSNNVNLLFAGLPTDGRKQIRTLIEGLCEPVATATAGLFLLVAASRISPEQLSIYGIALAFICLGLVFVQRHDYVGAIAANLRRDWLDFSLPAEPPLAHATPADLDLTERQIAGPDDATTAFALRVLWINDRRRGVSALIEVLQRTPPAHQEFLQPLIDEILAQTGSAASHDLRRWLANRELDLEEETLHPSGLAAFAPSEAPDATLRPKASGAAALALWRTWRVSDSREALRQVEDLLAASDEASLLAGLRALGELKEPRYAYLLRDYLRSPAPAVRREALAALGKVADRTIRVLTPELLAALRDGNGEQRTLAIQAFERLGDSAALPEMLATAGTFTPSERRQTEQMIARLGPSTVPTLIVVAESRNYTVTARSVALRSLGRLALPQLQVLAARLVYDTTLTAYRVLGSALVLRAGDSTEPGQAVLQRIYLNYPRLVLEIVLETLTVAGRLPGYEAVVAGLSGAGSKERGYAMEAVEQACDRKTFEALLPLIDGRPIEDQVAFGRSLGLVPPLTVAQVVAGALESAFPLEAAAGAQALHALDAAGSVGVLLAKLRSMPRTLLQRTVLVLFGRDAAGISAAPGDLTPVEAIRVLMEAPALAGAMFTHYEFLAALVQRVTPAEGAVLCRRGEPLSGLWFVQHGTVRVEGGAACGPGTSVGLGALRGGRPAPATLTAGPALTAVFVRADDIRRCIEIYPDLGLTLLTNEAAG